MSHFTSLQKVAITDVSAFIKAAKELGFTEVKRNAKMRGFAGNTQQAEVVVSHPKCEYDIGLVKNNGKLEVVSDWWGVDHTVSNAADRISQLTTKHTIVSKYSKMGFMAQTVTDKKGNIVVNLTR